MGALNDLFSWRSECRLSRKYTKFSYQLIDVQIAEKTSTLPTDVDRDCDGDGDGDRDERTKTFVESSKNNSERERERER